MKILKTCALALYAGNGRQWCTPWYGDPLALDRRWLLRAVVWVKACWYTSS